MEIFKILLGFSALLLAWSLAFRTGLIFRLNAWLKENVFNDQVLLYSRRRLALLLFVLGMVALFSGIENVLKEQKISPEAATNLLNQIQKDFKARDYARVVSICRILLRSEPKNVSAREFLINALWASGSKEDAFREATFLNRIDPANRTAQTILSRMKPAGAPPQ